MRAVAGRLGTTACLAALAFAVAGCGELSVFNGPSSGNESYEAVLRKQLERETGERVYSISCLNTDPRGATRKNCLVHWYSGYERFWCAAFDDRGTLLYAKVDLCQLSDVPPASAPAGSS